MSQKRCCTIKENNQNWINIYVLSFKAMTIMASYYFFVHMNVKKFKPKIQFDEIISLSFDLELLKMNNVLNNNQFCKGLSKGFI